MHTYRAWFSVRGSGSMHEVDALSTARLRVPERAVVRREKERIAVGFAWFGGGIARLSQCCMQLVESKVEIGNRSGGNIHAVRLFATLPFCFRP